LGIPAAVALPFLDGVSSAQTWEQNVGAAQK
jgi:hypothetical protein